MLLISIVDNSERDTAHLHTLLENYFNRTNTAYVEQIYKSGAEFVRRTENSDIVFMDICMDKLDGLETARIMRKLGSEAQLIFLSARPELAIHGYEVDALDFLLKPVEPAAVTFALDKAMKRLENKTGVYLALKLPKGIISLSSNDITYVEVFDHNLVYHTVKGNYNVRGRLCDVYEMLDHEHFIACNRSFVVNLRYVSGIWTDHLMVEDTKITISKSYRKEIMSRFASCLRKSDAVK